MGKMRKPHDWNDEASWEYCPPETMICDKTKKLKDRKVDYSQNFLVR